MNTQNQLLILTTGQKGQTKIKAVTWTYGDYLLVDHHMLIITRGCLQFYKLLCFKRYVSQRVGLSLTHPLTNQAVLIQIPGEETGELG